MERHRIIQHIEPIQIKLYYAYRSDIEHRIRPHQDISVIMIKSYRTQQQFQSR